MKLPCSAVSGSSVPKAFAQGHMGCAWGDRKLLRGANNRKPSLRVQLYGTEELCDAATSRRQTLG